MVLTSSAAPATSGWNRIFFRLQPDVAGAADEVNIFVLQTEALCPFAGCHWGGRPGACDADVGVAVRVRVVLMRPDIVIYVGVATRVVLM